METQQIVDFGLIKDDPYMMFYGKAIRRSCNMFLNHLQPYYYLSVCSLNGDLLTGVYISYLPDNLSFSKYHVVFECSQNLSFGLNQKEMLTDEEIDQVINKHLNFDFSHPKNCLVEPIPIYMFNRDPTLFFDFTGVPNPNHPLQLILCFENLTDGVKNLTLSGNSNIIWNDVLHKNIISVNSISHSQ